MLQLADRRPARLFRRVRRAVLARRRLLAALLTGVAVAAGVQAATAPPPPSVGVVTAARDLPAGAVLGSDDLVTLDFAPDSVPSGATRDAVGRTLASPVRRGEPVTDVRLLGPALTAGEPGLTAVPVRLPDAGMVELLEVGDRIDLIGTDPQSSGASVVATGVPVLALPRPSTDTTGSGQAGGLVVVGASPTEVTTLTDASVRLFLTYAFSH
ncbi:MAG TPA: SAF domain-containing protein [Nocardioides sp.]|jgi:Flp pilus assembly protein CpaB|nr:SAF domain-containing protein [Nocardioides sp.]